MEDINLLRDLATHLRPGKTWKYGVKISDATALADVIERVCDEVERLNEKCKDALGMYRDAHNAAVRAESEVERLNGADQEYHVAKLWQERDEAREALIKIQQERARSGYTPECAREMYKIAEDAITAIPPQGEEKR